jgi:hypothetical protein
MNDDNMSSELASLDLSAPLIDPLNALLDHLGLPFVLDTPLDLTPSLLLAILESLLQSRLPISASIRQSRSDAAKVQAMKIFLGVLETDVLNEDVGLSDIDPRRLATGEWEEVVFIAKLLCWLGKQMGSLPPKDNLSSIIPRKPPSTANGNTRTSILEVPRIASPSTRSTATNTVTSGFSFDREYQESETTVQSVHSVVTETWRPRNECTSSQVEHRRRPQCIHEIEDPSFLVQESEEELKELLRAEHDSLARDYDDTTDAYCDCSQDESSSINPYLKGCPSSLVRYDGYIQEVDADLELRTFEARKAAKRLHARPTPETVRDNTSVYCVSRSRVLTNNPPYSPIDPTCHATLVTPHPITIRLHYSTSVQSCSLNSPIWI